MKIKDLRLGIVALSAFISFPDAAFTQGSFWSTSGNTGTSSSANFAGTRDSTDFVIRTNKVRRITVKANGDVGVGVFSVAHKLDVGGNLNIRPGFGLYLHNQKFISMPGDNNLFIGQQAGENSDGFDNFFIGTQSGRNGGGFHNTIIGYQAGLYNFGANNTFCGYQSGVANTAGTYNTFFGLATGYSNTIGDGNSLFGQNVLGSNISGSWNCSFGFEAGNMGNTSGNCFFGVRTGFANITGANNTFIGYMADANGSDYSNSTCIGNTAQLTASNQVRLGNSEVTSIGGYADWSNISDGRFKTGIQENVPGLDFITGLKPVTYHLNVTGINKFVQRNHAVAKEGMPPVQTAAGKRAMEEKEKIVYSGFVAQEVESAAQKVGFHFSGVDAPKNENDLYGLRYAQFVVPLVKAVQELASQNDDMKKQLDALQRQVNDLLLKTGVSAVGQTNAARLEQNSPNPFGQACIISYFIPAGTSNAAINIYAANGKLVRSYAIPKNGNGQLHIRENSLASGLYYYTLLVNSKSIDTRQMLITK
ncbi:tail fiber domain-containing protein [Foetidibacter luteolus]|uniref:tail fiber domain-containing protein n=1 Tax=Foetidibacter luteolus TaxID=2608880 RepID=UPI001A99F19F|nr:tail fiber domain-containing protein [Foetidibacter luteolus]